MHLGCTRCVEPFCVRDVMSLTSYWPCSEEWDMIALLRGRATWWACEWEGWVIRASISCGYLHYRVYFGKVIMVGVYCYPVMRLRRSILYYGKWWLTMGNSFIRSDGVKIDLIPEPYCKWCSKPIRKEYSICYNCNIKCNYSPPPQNSLLTHLRHYK